MDRRKFIVSSAAFAGVAVLPGAVSAACPKVVISFWSLPWPGLIVNTCNHGYQQHFLMYLTDGSHVVRVLLPREHDNYRYHGWPVHKVSRSDLDPEYADRVIKRFNSIRSCLPEDRLGPAVLVREKVEVYVNGPREVFEKYRSEIPSTWKFKSK